MTKPFLVPFKAEHMLAFVNRDTDITMDMREARRREVRGPAFTGMSGRKVLGCAGVMLLWPGVGEAWVALDKDIGQHGIWMTKMIRRILHDITKGCDLHRVEAVVLADNTRNLTWIEHLGFSREYGKAQRYTQDKKDAVRFEFVR